MSPEGYAYVAGGAGTEETIRENRAAFERWRIVPRMLRDVSPRDGVEVLGTPLLVPARLCPIGVLEMAHRDADVAVARAAAAEGIPFVFSNQASRPMEETARAMDDAPRWFQLYWSTHDELVESLVSRAEACGCSAIVLTLDTTMLGWRIRDLDLAYLPFLRGKGIAQYTSDPVFLDALQETLRQAPRPAGASRSRRSRPSGSSPGRSRPRGSTASVGPRARGGAALRRDVLALRSRGTTSPSCASARACRSCSRASSTLPTPEQPSSTAWTGSWSRTTAGVRWTARSRRWTPFPGSSTRWPGVSRSSSTAASARAPTSSARSRWEPSGSGLGRPSCGASPRRRGRRARGHPQPARGLRPLMGLAGCAAIAEIGRDSVQHA